MTKRIRKPKSAAKNPERSLQEKQHVDELLDEGLKETFPASDPLAILEPAPDQHRPEENPEE